MKLSKIEEERRILSYSKWRQTIPLSKEFTTPGYLDLSKASLVLPPLIKDKSFLEIGANDGYYCFLAEKMGASHVIASDIYSSTALPTSNGGGWPIEGIQMVKDYLNSKVEIKSLNVYDLAQQGIQVQVTLISNVIAWLDDIPKAIEIMSACTEECLIIHDSFLNKYKQDPLIRYEIDDKCKYRVNLCFMEKILKEKGFTKIEVIPAVNSSLVERFNKKIYRIKPKSPVFESFDSKEAFKNAEFTSAISIAEKDGRHLLFELGWLNESDLEFVELKSKGMMKMLRSVVGDVNFERLKTKLYDRKNDLKEYTLIAHR